MSVVGRVRRWSVWRALVLTLAARRVCAMGVLLGCVLLVMLWVVGRNRYVHGSMPLGESEIQFRIGLKTIVGWVEEPGAAASVSAFQEYEYWFIYGVTDPFADAHGLPTVTIYRLELRFDRLIVVLMLLALVVMFPTFLQRFRAVRTRKICRKCGYILDGDRGCPECGAGRD